MANSLRRLDRIVSVGVPPLFDLPKDIRDWTTMIPNGVDRDVYAYGYRPLCPRRARLSLGDSRYRRVA